MTKALYYPKANRTAQNFAGAFLGSTIDPDKIVWHTTETGGFPAYGGGATAPHWTYHADIHEWRQHFPANRSSRALRNEAGGVQTNTEDALQVEIVAYSDERLAAQRGHLPVSKLDSRALDDLADFARWANREWGVPLSIDPGWLRSNFNLPPMSFAQWTAFRGHCGHNRVPENTHWDPARLDIDEVIRRARAGGSETLPDTGEELTVADISTIMAKLDDIHGDLIDTAGTVKNNRGEIPSKVWAREVPRSADGVETRVPALQELADAKTIAMRLEVKVDTLLKLLATGSDLTAEQIKAAVNEAIDERIDDARVELVVEDEQG